MWTVKIRDQTAHSVQSDLDLHYPQKLLVLSLVREELIHVQMKKTKQDLSILTAIVHKWIRMWSKIMIFVFIVG